jgi:hypothetical protein
VDRRHDVFATGAIIWEMLVGKPLFDLTTPAEYLEQVEAACNQAPSQFRDDVPETLNLIVMTALHPDRQRRYASAWELERALRGFLAERSASNCQARIAARMEQLFGHEMQRRRMKLKGVVDQLQLELDCPLVEEEIPIDVDVDLGDPGTDPANHPMRRLFMAVRRRIPTLRKTKPPTPV